jgi:L-malate glycosyltransferase
MQTLMLTNVLQSCCHAVEVVCHFEHKSSMVEEFQATGASVRLLDMNRKSGSWTVIKRLREEIWQHNPDVVHVQYMSPGALPIIAARLAGIKRIFATVHQPYTKSHRKLAKILLRASALLTTKFIAVSQNAEKSWFGKSCLFDQNKPFKLQPRHFTIHNAIDIERIWKIISEVSISDLKNELAIPTGIPIIGAVSRLRNEKGIDVLLEAFNLLIRCGEKAHLLLVGSGPDERKLKDTAQTYGLNSYITFYGEAEWEKAIQLMAIMDLLVVSSRFEGFGLTAAEAMAAGKPLIASDTSGLKEVVSDNQTGILFPVEDVPALMDAMAKLISDPVLRNNLGMSGREKVIANFSLDIFRKKIQALYEGLS